MQASLHCLGRRQAEDIEHHLNAMQPVVPARGFSDIVATNRSQPFGVAIEVCEDAANIGRIERQVNHRIRPIEALVELRALRRSP